MPDREKYPLRSNEVEGDFIIKGLSGKWGRTGGGKMSVLRDARVRARRGTGVIWKGF